MIAMAVGMWAEVLPYPVDTINGKLYYRYTVEKSVGLYRISKMFDCTQEEIIDLNPQLKERGLHFEEVIFVPMKAEAAVEPVKPAAAEAVKPAEAPVVTVEPEVPAVPEAPVVEVVEAAPAEEEVKVLDDAMRIALLLPLQATAVERTPMMERFFDFYAGALLAVNDLQASGEKIDLTILDIDKGHAKLEQILAEGTLAGMQGIVGPAYPPQVSCIAPYVLAHRIPCLIPFTEQIEEIGENPYLMQFNAPSETEALVMANWLEQHKSEVNCVLVEARESDIPESIQQLRTAIRLKGIPYTTVNVRQILNDSINEVLKDSVENILLFNTERYNNLSMLLPHVVNSKGAKQVTLLSQYSWQNEKIVLPQIYATEFATELPVDLKQYEADFAHWFGIERSSTYPRYDLLGYDMVRQLAAHLKGAEYFGLQSDIRMERVSERGGWINKNVQVVRK